MSLNNEYSKKIDRLLELLPKRYYKPIGNTTYSGFITKNRLSLEEAKCFDNKPFVKGTEWGCKWEYAWLFTQIKIPFECDNKRVVFRSQNGEGIVYVNNMIYGSLDKEHTEIVLSQNARANDIYEIAYEAYAGHGPEMQAAAIIPGEKYGDFPENIKQRTLTDGEFGVVDDEIFGLYMDLKTLNHLRNAIDDDSLRCHKINLALKKICAIVDIEDEENLFLDEVAQARKLLKPILACKNGSSTPTIYAIGHSHLDLEWLWCRDETYRKVARTLGNQLRLCDEYNEYKYIQSQPWILETVKKDYPVLYKSIKNEIEKGNIIPEGGTWVEPDTNIPSGESLVRQFIFGKKFIKDEFNKESCIFWLPDSFGASAAVPQIMEGCGVKYFYTAKIPWSYNHNLSLPFGTYMWRGIDGTSVLAHINSGYAATLEPDKLIMNWSKIDNKDEVDSMICSFGHGDGGGGATRVHLEYAKREKNLEGMPKVKIASPIEFYKNVEKNAQKIKEYKGELWYSEHKATYTTQATLKRLNRKSEIAVHDAEFWTTLLQGGNSQKKSIDILWKKILFNQFHDILPGTSIKKVCERAESDYKEVLSEADEIIDNALLSFVNNEKNTITVFNSLPWNRMVEIELDDNIKALKDGDGNIINAYVSENKRYVTVPVNACGFNSFVCILGTINVSYEKKINKRNIVLENDHIKVKFDDEGNILSYIYKKNNIEYISKKSNEFKIYKNHPGLFDAWDVDDDYEEKEILFENSVKAEIVTRNSQKTVMRIKRKILDSIIEQTVVLKNDSPRLDFITKVNWNETHKILKVLFNTNINTDELISEIQFGHIKRPNHTNYDQDVAQYEKFQHKWSALIENNRGMAILNDCKYGISTKCGSIGLTLLNSSMAPMIDADKGLHEFTYSICPIGEEYELINVIKDAYELNYPVIAKNGYAGNKSFFRVSQENIIIETVKTAEDGSGDIIVRLYEASNKKTKCIIGFEFAVEKAYITNMLEEVVRELNIEKSCIELDFDGFKIITLRLKKL